MFDFLGRLDELALKHDFIEYMAGLSMAFGAIFVVALLTYLKRWKWIWNEWLTTVDHKKIGIMYIIFSAVMFSKGLIDGLMMRLQQAMATAEGLGYLEHDHYQQIFTAHGVTMIFFVGMGLIFGLINYILPLQIGARDVAFPFLNSISFWLFVSGGVLVLVSLVVGVYADTGWTAYPPLSGLKYSPGVGVDYWLWSLQISGAGSLLSGINFLVTILKMRCPGMTLWRMPVFVWATLATVILIVISFPILTATAGMLTTDRLLETKIFTATHGGSPMMYINLLWAWGHPEVYILVLPIFGIFSEVVPVFCHKKLFGYTSMVWAILAITFFSFLVWLHHFFTMGGGASVNAFFGIMTAVIAIPTGAKVFNWLFTMYRGRIEFATPMLWFMGFVFLFVVGGMAGVLMSVPAIDFQMHNTLFLVAHFHSVMVGAILFGFFSGYTYWFPKMTGLKLNEAWGRRAFWCWFIGFIIAFLPLYLLGLMGAARRLDYYDAATGWQPLFVVALVGALILSLGPVCQVIQLLVTVLNKEKYRCKGDPWDVRTLEWATSSPPPFYNFAHIPEVTDRDAYLQMKGDKKQGGYRDIHMPTNTSLGVVLGGLSFLIGFGLIWYMYWLAAVGAVGTVVCLIVRLYRKDTEYYVKAEEVKEIEQRIQSA